MSSSTRSVWNFSGTFVLQSALGIQGLIFAIGYTQIARGDGNFSLTAGIQGNGTF